MTPELITLALMGFSGLHVGMAGVYVLTRDTRLNGERITPLAIRIAGRIGRR